MLTEQKKVKEKKTVFKLVYSLLCTSYSLDFKRSFFWMKILKNSLGLKEFREQMILLFHNSPENHDQYSSNRCLSISVNVASCEQPAWHTFNAARLAEWKQIHLAEPTAYSQERAGLFDYGA